jgi:hypothetical protein
LNIREALLSEHSKRQTMKIASYVGGDKERFAAVAKCMFDEDQKLSARAAWVFSDCAGQHPELVKPYMNQMVSVLTIPVHDAVKRNVIRVLQTQEIPRRLQGKLAAILFSILQTPAEPIAIRVFSMTVLANLCMQHPDLKNELKMVIESQLPFSSAGFKSRAKKLMKQIEE